MAKAGNLLRFGAGAAAALFVYKVRQKRSRRAENGAEYGADPRVDYNEATTARFYVDEDLVVRQYSKVGDLLEWRTFGDAQFIKIEVGNAELLQGDEEVSHGQFLYPDSDNPRVVRARVLRGPQSGDFESITGKVFLKTHGGHKEKATDIGGVGRCQGCY